MILSRKEKLPVILDRKMIRSHVAQKYGTIISMPVMKTGLFMEQQRGKETQTEILKGTAQETIKDRNMETVINEPRKDNVHEEIRAALSTM